jgi:hypothetical protein
MSIIANSHDIPLADLLGRLAPAMEKFVRAKTGQMWSVSLDSGPDASLLISLRQNEDSIALNWMEGDKGMTFSGVPGIFSYGRVSLDRSGQSEDVLTAAIGQVLASVVKRNLFEPLLPKAPNREQLSDKTAMARIRKEIESHAQHWDNCRLTNIQYRRGALLVTYASPTGDVRFVVSLDSDYPPENEKSQVAFLFERRGARLFAQKNTPTNLSTDEITKSLGQLLAFCIARALPRLLSDSNSNLERTEKELPRELTYAIAENLNSGQSESLYGLPFNERWKSFTADGEIERMVCYSWMSSPIFLFVQHAERGCINMRPVLHAPLNRLFHYPWPMIATSGDQEFPFYFADLAEDGLIMHGGEERLSRLIAFAAKTKARGSHLVLRKTCVPRMLGEDTAPALALAKEKFGVKVHRFAPEDDFQTPHESLGQIVASMIKPDSGFQRSSSPSINLVGYESGAGRRELVSLLTEIGIAVNTFQIPDIDPVGLENYPRGWLQVFRPFHMWEPIYENVFRPLGIPDITPQAPYGVANTFRWLREIAEALGIEKDVEKQIGAISRLWAKKSASWRNSSESQPHRLGFVVSFDKLGRLWRPEGNAGLKPAAILGELGFEIVAHIWLAAKDRFAESIIANKAKKELLSQGVSEKNVKLDFFSTKQELDELLSTDGTQAVFSDYSQDQRLLAQGKNTFSLADFEPGFRGAERTYHRLASRCKMSFASRYHKVCRHDAN